MKKRAYTGALVLALLAAFAAPFASSEPDGLQRVARDEGFGVTEREHSLRDGPFAGYGFDAVDGHEAGRSMAAFAGVVLTFLLAFAVTTLVSGIRNRRRAEEP